MGAKALDPGLEPQKLMWDEGLNVLNIMVDGMYLGGSIGGLTSEVDGKPAGISLRDEEAWCHDDKK